jgi:transposase InsO family protein
MSYIPPGAPWANGYIESFNNRLRRECRTRRGDSPMSCAETTAKQCW